MTPTLGIGRVRLTSVPPLGVRGRWQRSNEVLRCEAPSEALAFHARVGRPVEGRDLRETKNEEATVLCGAPRGRWPAEASDSTAYPCRAAGRVVRARPDGHWSATSR